MVSCGGVLEIETMSNLKGEIMTGEQKKVKGTASNIIACVFITLQILLIIDSLDRGNPQYPSFSFRLGYIFAGNIFGIGALVLSLTVWALHKNLTAITITIIAAIVIVINTLVQI